MERAIVTPIPAQRRRVAPRTPQRRRVLLYNPDLGLGATLTIAVDLARRRTDAALLALTGVVETHAYDLPANLDYIRLPPAARRDLYAELPDGQAGGAFGGVFALREAVIQEVVDAFAPELVVVEQAPAGLGRELVRALACLRAAEPRVTLVAVLAAGDDAREAPALSDEERGLLAEVYDQVLACGPGVAHAELPAGTSPCADLEQVGALLAEMLAR